MKAMDPVCGMEVETATAQWTTDYKGTMYYFCAPGCKRSFEQDPEKYLRSAGAVPRRGIPPEHMGHAPHEH